MPPTDWHAIVADGHGGALLAFNDACLVPTTWPYPALAQAGTGHLLTFDEQIDVVATLSASYRVGTGRSPE